MVGWITTRELAFQRGERGEERELAEKSHVLNQASGTRMRQVDIRPLITSG